MNKKKTAISQKGEKKVNKKKDSLSSLMKLKAAGKSASATTSAAEKKTKATLPAAKKSASLKNFIQKVTLKAQKTIASTKKTLEKVGAKKRALGRPLAVNAALKGQPVVSKKTAEEILEPEIIVMSQEAVENTKYDTGVEVVSSQWKSPEPELPPGYNEDKIVLQVRDPWWVHAYWDLREATLGEIGVRWGDAFLDARAVLRVYDVTAVDFNGNNAHKYFDVQIQMEARSWYLNLQETARSWCVDLGFVLRDGQFICIARSNVITTPADGPSHLTDEEWMVPDDLFAYLYRSAFRDGGLLGPNSPGGRRWQDRPAISVTSPGLFSPSISSPVYHPRVGRKKDFWLVVNTELIVYGATEPDAQVTVCGKPVKLNPDGTFSLRFALPDGQQSIPVQAYSKDGEDERLITPHVTKETR